MSELIEFVWRELKTQIDDVKQQAEVAQRTERSLIADSLPAYTLATAPLAAQGGLGTGSSYITLAWISDGRKAGEGAGTGTGVLAVYESATDQWLRLTDYSAVVV